MNWKKTMFSCMRGVLFSVCLVGAASGQVVLDEDFDTVTGTGGLDVLIGSGHNEVPGFDDGILGEGAFVGTWGDANIPASFVEGVINGGINGTGSASLMIDNATFDVGGWYGAYIWRDLALPTLDETQINMRAMVRGDTFQAPYLMRIEAQKSVPFGLDEGFGDATGEGGGVFLLPGGVNGWTPNWDTGIDGEAAFAGVGGTAQVFGSVSANAVIGDGLSGNGGQIVVDAVSFGPGGGWWAGMVWGNQPLPDLPFEEIELSASIRGTRIQNLGEQYGDYQLRIEDQDQDWITFTATSNGSWQNVGGFLSQGIEGGFGDQIFDRERGPFGVVVVFDNDDGNTWGFGGTLTIDNLFLTGGFNTEVAGSVTFDGDTGTSVSSYKSIGGRIDTGLSTFDNIEDDFEGASGTGGGEFFNNTSGATGFTPGYDEGVNGEGAFAGFWGSVSVGSVSANGLLSGGMGNSEAVQLSASNMEVNGTGGWWAGLMWQGQVLPERPLNEIELRADIRGFANGGSMGQYHLRIEDAQGDYLGFVTQANGSFQSVGGLLSEAEEGTFIGDGTFHIDQGPFTVVVAFFDEANTWGTGGNLIVDNLFMTPADFATGADTFAAVVAFADETASWGNGGELEIDNVAIAIINPDADMDADVDLADFSAIQNCFSGSDDFESNACLGLDADGDLDIDVDDTGSLINELGGPE